MNRFAERLWPASERKPMRRLVLALIGAPLMVSLMLGVIAFLVASMTEARRDDVLGTAIDSALALTQVIYIFTLTFGIIGIGALWALGQRGSLVWALMGALLGGIAGFFFGLILHDAPAKVVLFAFALIGWLIFLLLRWMAGVRKG